MGKNYKLLLQLFLPLTILSTYLVLIKPEELFFVFNDYYFQFIASVFLGLIVLLSFFTKKTGFINFNILDLSVILFFVYISIRLKFTEGDNFLELSYLSKILVLVSYFYGKLIHSKSNKDLNKVFLPALLSIGFIQIIIGLFQYSGIINNLFPGYRIGGTLGNPGPFANLIACFTIISFYELLYNKAASRRYRFFIILCLLLFLFGIVISKARTSWIATIIGIIYLLYSKFGIPSFITSFLSSFKRKAIVVLILLVILVSSGYFLYSFKKDSTNGRILIWSNTIDLILDYPVVGVGYERFNANVHNYQIEYFENNPDSKFQKLAGDVQFAFNDFLQMTANFGLLGLLIFLGIILIPFCIKLNIKNEDCFNRSHLICSKAVIIVILVESLFSYPLQTLPICILFFYFLGLISGNIPHGFTINISNVLLRISRIVLLCTVLLFAFYSYKMLKSAKNWYQANSMFEKGYIDEALSKYDQLSQVFNGYEPFYYNYSYQLMNANMHEEAILIMQRTIHYINDYEINIRLGVCNYYMNEFEKAGYYYTKASYLIPSKIYPKYLLIKLYLSMGKTDLAKEKCEEFIKTKSKFYTSREGELKVEIVKILEELNNN